MTRILPPAVPALAAAFALALLGGAPTTASAQPGGEEVPFITSPDAVTLAMLRAAQTSPGDHVIDLGSGDGRIVITAARRFGATGLGVEIVPELVERSRRAAADAGVARQVQFHVQDLFQTDLSAASVITMYLLPEFNLRLRPGLLALRPGTRIVSHDWDMGDWQPDQTETLPVPDKPVGREKLSRVHLWWVPAQVAGRWCAGDGRELRLEQQHQMVQGQMLVHTEGAAVLAHPLAGRLRGAAIELLGLQGRWYGQWDTSGPAGTGVQRLSLRQAGTASLPGETTVWQHSPQRPCAAAPGLKP
jgi:SAM-dependent methyltransferase